MYPKPPPPAFGYYQARTPYNRQQLNQQAPHRYPSYGSSQGQYDHESYSLNPEQSSAHERKTYQRHGASGKHYSQANVLAQKRNDDDISRPQRRGASLTPGYQSDYVGNTQDSNATSNYSPSKTHSSSHSSFYPPVNQSVSSYQSQGFSPLLPQSGFPLPPPPPRFAAYQQYQSFQPLPPPSYGIVPPPPIPPSQWSQSTQHQWFPPPPPPILRASSYGSQVPQSTAYDALKSTRGVQNPSPATKYQSPQPKEKSPIQEVPQLSRTSETSDVESNTGYLTGVDHNYAGWAQDEFEYDPDESVDGYEDTVDATDAGETRRNRLALGIIVWHPGTLVSQVLPAHYSDAEIQSSNPPPLHVEGTSASKYATADNLEESCLPIRNTDHWSLCKDDPVFRDLSGDDRIISFAQLRSNTIRRSRNIEPLDTEIEEGEVVGEMTVEDNRVTDWIVPENGSYAIHDQRTYIKDHAENLISTRNAADTGEMINSRVTSKSYATKSRFIELPETDTIQPNASSNSLPPTNSKATEVVQYQGKLTEAHFDSTATYASIEENCGRDQDTLARRGVTSPSKVVNNHPIAATFASPSRTSKTRSPQRSPTASHALPAKPPQPFPDAKMAIRPISEAPPPPPPPPPQTLTLSTSDAWPRDGFDRDGLVSPKSETSQHTLAGSDFYSDDAAFPNRKTSTGEIVDVPEPQTRETEQPIPQPDATNSRKRLRDGPTEEYDGVKRQVDDVTPRLKRRQPRVAAAYSRRW